MEQLSFVADSVLGLLNPTALILTVVGVIIGILFGAAPGLSGTTAMAVLLPITYAMPMEHAIVLFISIYVGSNFGNSIPAVLLGVPGTPSAVITAIEGEVFQKRGEGFRALMLVLTSSVYGQFIGAVGVGLFLFPFAELAVKFLFPEVFALGVLGLCAAAGLGKEAGKGLISGAIGLVLTTVGVDAMTGRARYAFGNLYLETGLDSTVVIIGLLIVGELVFRFTCAEGTVVPATAAIPREMFSWSAMRDHLKDFLFALRATTIGSIWGFIIGLVPAAGGAVGSVVAYQQSRMFARRPELYGGKGSLEAVAAADSAGNACVAGAAVPTFALGIPGSPAMVLVLSAMMLHGITPGPGFFHSEPESVKAMIGSLIVAPVVMLLLGLWSIKPSLALVRLSPRLLYVGALIVSLTGVFALQWRMFDVVVAVCVGLLSFGMRYYGFPILPASLGALLGGIIESNLRRGLTMTRGFEGFFSREPVVIILGLAVLFLAVQFAAPLKRRRTPEGPSTT